MKDFRSLLVWQKSHQLTAEIYKAATTLPKNEMHGLISQIRRAATSVPANIAEGCGRGSDSDLARFIQIAMGSASELEYQLLLSKDIEYLDDEKFKVLVGDVTEVKRMPASLIKTES